MGSGVAGEQKRMISVVSQHVHERKQFGKKLAEFQLMQKKIFEMSMEAYVMESELCEMIKNISVVCL